MIGATLRNTANPTMLGAGYKVNVIPGEAQAHVDGRFLPGLRGRVLRRRSTSCSGRTSPASSSTTTSPWRRRSTAPSSTRWRAALLAEDPDARAVPYMLSGGTDAKAFAKLGIRCYGFAPLRLPPTWTSAALFHGVDERVPVDALQFGARVLDRFLRAC